MESSESPFLTLGRKRSSSTTVANSEKNESGTYDDSFLQKKSHKKLKKIKKWSLQCSLHQMIQFLRERKLQDKKFPESESVLTQAKKDENSVAALAAIKNSFHIVSSYYKNNNYK